VEKKLIVKNVTINVPLVLMLKPVLPVNTLDIQLLKCVHVQPDSMNKEVTSVTLVTSNVPLVKETLITVSLVLKTEMVLQLVTSAQIISLMMVSMSLVNHVNLYSHIVTYVTKMDVSIVNHTEEVYIVHVLLDILKSLNKTSKSVSTVTTDVLLAPVIGNIVSHVPTMTKESTHLSVIVHSVNMMITLMISTVTFVMIDVLPVLTSLTTVLPVKLTEKMLQDVLVYLVDTNQETIVYLVPHNVKNVNLLLITVLFVLKPENILQNVNAQSVNTLTLITKSVKIVLTNVKLVKNKTLVVPSVEETESLPQNVIAHMDISNLTNNYVQDVHTNVMDVLNLKNIVKFVLKTEFMFQSVLAQLVSITLKTKLTVQLVTKNVNLVSLPPTTVSNVLKD
jgi:hypothetical protein